jgi:UDP-glucose 4-epimerase
MTSKKIFFTGGGGFMGREIIPLLKRSGHKVIAPKSRQLNLLDTFAVTEFVKENEFDVIIHAAMCSGTGRYGKLDGLEVLDKNLRMFENVFRYAGDVEKFINFDSGASLFKDADIPDTTYGFSKYTIARSVDAVDNGINLRVYGCFGSTEESTRFFATNIQNYIDKKPITIFRDRLMDFTYAGDIHLILEHALQTNIKDCDCVYSIKYRLTDIAEMINTLDIYDVPVIIKNSGMDSNYCGSCSIFNLDYIGLDQGIREIYESLC